MNEVLWFHRVTWTSNTHTHERRERRTMMFDVPSAFSSSLVKSVSCELLRKLKINRVWFVVLLFWLIVAFVLPLPWWCDVDVSSLSRRNEIDASSCCHEIRHARHSPSSILFVSTWKGKCNLIVVDKLYCNWRNNCRGRNYLSYCRSLVSTQENPLLPQSIRLIGHYFCWPRCVGCIPECKRRNSQLPRKTIFRPR